ncbi:hypothetical protein CAEBREN_04102 [Caenorhabditis brenneri]|uniref:Uncharacterized protein n=1 Tax=Caenorhabditis brenneri TaxID=135651 RepID=G0MTC9_CAEBE|nr:hypothetical protein CAEBREN_04102 [Caenorhabditis brenneri]
MRNSSLFLLFILFALTLSAPLPLEASTSEATPSDAILSDTTTSTNQTDVEEESSNAVFEYEQKGGYLFYSAAPNSGGSIEFEMGDISDDGADFEEYMKSFPEYVGKFRNIETKLSSPDQTVSIGYYNLEGNGSARAVVWQKITNLGDPNGPFVVTGGYRYEID